MLIIRFRVKRTTGVRGEIYQSIIHFEQQHHSGLNGFILLMHIGTDAGRTDKFYKRLPELIEYLKKRGYQLVTIKGLLY
jgi:endoglucanase